MALTDLLARPLAAGIFSVGGFDSLRHPDKKVPTAQTVTAPITQATGLDTEALVRVNGAVQVGAGLALAPGRLPRLAALLLIGSLVPTTVAGHRFWEIDDADLPPALVFRQDKATHGMIEPKAETTLAAYEMTLASSRDKWRLVSPPSVGGQP